MSMISEQIDELRAVAEGFGHSGIQRMAKQAADTIEELSAKLASANMERSTAYYNDGWIPVSEGLPNALEDVLVWCEGVIQSGTCIGERCQWYGLGFHCNGIWQVYQMKDIKSIKVLAFQPLPKPYQPKGEKRLTQ